MKWFVGGGAAVGALFTMAACDHTDEEDDPKKEAKKNPGICGRSTAGSAFNGALLGALSGFFAHIVLEKMGYSFLPAVDRPVDLVTFRVPVGRGR